MEFRDSRTVSQIMTSVMVDYITKSVT